MGKFGRLLAAGSLLAAASCGNKDMGGPDQQITCTGDGFNRIVIEKDTAVHKIPFDPISLPTLGGLALLVESYNTPSSGSLTSMTLSQAGTESPGRMAIGEARILHTLTGWVVSDSANFLVGVEVENLDNQRLTVGASCL